MLGRVVPAGLEHVEEPDEVALDIGPGVVDRVAHPGLGRQVHDAVEAALGEQPLHQRGVAQVAPHEDEPPLGVGLPQHPQAVLLDAGVVVGVDAVQADDMCVGCIEQALRQERAYEAGGAGYEYRLHFLLSVLPSKTNIGEFATCSPGLPAIPAAPQLREDRPHVAPVKRERRRRRRGEGDKERGRRVQAPPRVPFAREERPHRETRRA